LLSNAKPFDPFVLSRKTEVCPSLSILVIWFACVSVKIKLPSGKPIGPSVPRKPDLMTWIFVPPAMTPGISGATVSVGRGGGGGEGGDGMGACARAAAVTTPKKEVTIIPRRIVTIAVPPPPIG
jgi:hypothetical protein